MACVTRSILILEDNAQRLSAMREAVAGLRLPVAPTVRAWENAFRMRRECAEFLPETFLISLDYDLSGCRDPGAGASGTGGDMVEFLLGRKPCAGVILHTSMAEKGAIL